MVQRFNGTIQARPTRAKRVKLYNKQILLGAYTIDGKEYSSKIDIFVYLPGSVEHVPGLFLRLSNPIGQSYSRITGLVELNDLIGQLQQIAIDPKLSEALDSAAEAHAILKTADLYAQQIHKPTPST